MSYSKTISLVFIANFINLIVSFLLLPILSRLLSYEEYATYSQLILFSTLFQLLFGMGLSSVFNLLFSLNSDKKNNLFYTSANLLLVLSVIGILLAIVFNQSLNYIFNNPRFFTFCLYFSPFIIGQLFNSVFYTILIIESKTFFIVITTIITNVLRILFVFISLYYYQSFYLFIISQSVITLLQAFLYFYFIPGTYKKNILFIDIKILKEIAKYGLPMMFTGILGMGILQIDGIFIGKFLGLKDFAIYRNGAIEFPLAGIIFSSLVSVSVPYYIKLKEQSGLGAVLSTKRRISQLAATIIFPLSIYLFYFSDFFVKAYLSEKYILSAPIFAWYNIALLIRFNDYQDLLLIHGKTKSLFQINLVTFIICIVVNYFLIKHLGLTGAIISFLLNLYLIAVLLVIFTQRALKISLHQYQNWNSIFTILFVSLSVGGILYWVKQSFNNGLAINVVTSILYMISVLFIFYKMKLLDDTLISKARKILRLSDK